MRPSQIHARAIATACAVGLIMSLTPTTSYAQVPIPGSVTPSNAQINALTNNPNGPEWLKKFDRQPQDMPTPMHMNGTHHKMSHKMMMMHRMMMGRMKKQSMCMPMPKPTTTK